MSMILDTAVQNFRVFNNEQAHLQLMEDDQANPAEPPAPIVAESPHFDLESYAANYSGYMKLLRLMYIADHCPALKLEALRLALSHIQQTMNAHTYQQIYKKISEMSGNELLPDIALSSPDVPAYDTQWVDTTQKRASLKLEKLDTDLKNYKSNSIKESIRRGHDDLGDHYLECGDLSNALKCYSRARDYCTSSKHMINMCLNVVQVSVYLQNWSHVLSFVMKAEAIPDASNLLKDQQVTKVKLKCAAGLAELVNSRYKSAAKNFLQAHLDYCTFPELISPYNVATYGGLCALASFDREELQKLVIGSVQFRQFLELDPQLRDIITLFYDSKYASSLRLMNEIKNTLLLDMYLAKHVDKLYSQIRDRALCQYFSPYMSADLAKMAVAFNTNVVDLENELAVLILDGQINARIDSHNKILYSKDVNQRSSSYDRCLTMGQEYCKATTALVLRAAVVKSGIHVKFQAKDDKQDQVPTTSASSSTERIGE